MKRAERRRGWEAATCFPFTCVCAAEKSGSLGSCSRHHRCYRNTPSPATSSHLNYILENRVGLHRQSKWGV